MTAPAPEGWLGQSGLAWNILLTADVAPPPMDILRERLGALAVRQGWSGGVSGAVVEGDRPDLLRRLAAREEHTMPVAVGRWPEGVVVGAHHAYVDGLGLLTVLGELCATSVTSRAVGVDEGRANASVARTLARRLAEVAVHPPAGVAGDGDGTDRGDVFARATVEGQVRTAALVGAGAGAVADTNRARGRRGDRVAVAVGVSRAGGTRTEVADDSGFLRLTDVERLSAAELEAAIGRAPLQFGGSAQGAVARATSGLIRTGARLLARRLGSTLLVSHLGTIEADGLDALTFHPLIGGGSGVALGAATQGGRTVLTLRARGAAHITDDLERLLAAIADRLS